MNTFVKDRVDSFLSSIVERLDTSLIPPHAPVIKQGEFTPNDNLFYFVGKGSCKVTVRNPKGKEITVNPVLGEGEHFGEIALIYNCERTATVYSMNYNTFATMKEELYKRLV